MAYFNNDYASAARAIHDTLIQACSAHPLLNYKNGAFASTITSSRPVLSCLDLLIASPLILPKDNEVFLDLRKYLTRYKAREAQGKADPFDFMAQAILFMESLPDVFNADRRLRGVKPPPDMVIATAPEDFKDGETNNHVKLLLCITVDAIVLACSTEYGFKHGKFSSSLKRSTPLIAMLGLLSRDEASSDHHGETIFANALVEARKLLELQIQGVTTIEPHSLMYLEHRKWFGPMLRVFEKDFEARRVEKPHFKWYTFFPEMKDEDLEDMDTEQDNKNAGIPWPPIHVPGMMVSSGKAPSATKAEAKTSKPSSSKNFDAGFEKNVRGAFL
ncbi:hypothetical protein MMC17_006895 [Xylographa soralifera]|nr:hypothetical protein [Xylographa soralifera]